MSRRDDQRSADIPAAAAVIDDHITRGNLDDGLVFDAVRVRLIEIGEAVKAIDPELLAREPAIPWIDVAGMRNHLATGTSILPTESCRPPSPGTYHPSWPRPSDSSIILLLIPRRDRRYIRSLASRAQPRASKMPVRRLGSSD